MRLINKFTLKRFSILFILMYLLCAVSPAQIIWPQGQLLPSFPAAAATQDLIYLNGSMVKHDETWKWEAEGSELSHGTGSIDSDGWVCITGVDEANKHMIYGPYLKVVTSGSNVAEFRMKVDNNSANDDEIAEIDVRNVTTDETLASATITRKQFKAASNYESFNLPFTMLKDNQSIELRVYWKGTSYLKVDYVSVTQDNSDAQMYLFSSLKGIVNMTHPRIFSYEGDAFAEGPYTWLQSLGTKYVEYYDSWPLITKYRNEISGLVVYDPAQIHTVNLAIAIAKEKKALIASPSLLSRLTASPYNLPVLTDLRAKYSNKMEVYQALYDIYWPNIDHRLLIGLSPENHKASLREYAVALGAAVIWLAPDQADESELLNKFLGSMSSGSTYMGWWPEEESGVRRASEYGIATVASDYCTNLTFHSAMSREIVPSPMPIKPELKNKIYVSFILSDGDNIQYVEHLMRKLWNNADRGKVPMGWTLSPAMVDVMPGALNYYHKTSTENDNLISGPSGYGYTYPNFWNGSISLDQFVARTEEYNVKAGLRVVTIWNTINGGINTTVGESFESYAPSLLGLTAQNTGGALSIYNNNLPGKPLSCNYCSNEDNMKSHIATASSGWSGNEPRFIIIQSKPWEDCSPTTFMNVMNSLNSDYVVVRPDHIFQLIREANGISYNPGSVKGTGTGLIGEYFNGTGFETKKLTRNDANINFDWGTAAPANELNADNISVRWTGQIQPKYTCNYTFYITSDNGRKVWIDNQLIIDKWVNNGNVTYKGTIELEANRKYNIKVEYFETSGTANCKLEWASPFESRGVVPQSQLYTEYLNSGINELSSNDELMICPNPINNGFFSFKLINNSFFNADAVLLISDLCGKTIREATIKIQDKVDISKIPAGTYIVNLYTKFNTFRQKMVVQKNYR